MLHDAEPKELVHSMWLLSVRQGCLLPQGDDTSTRLALLKPYLVYLLGVHAVLD